jgi:hypothetical protein
MSEEGGGSRPSRRAKNKVNYAKEQEFSDEDLFEDEEENEREIQRTPAPRRGRPKGSSSKKHQAQQDDDGHLSHYPDEMGGGDGADVYRPPKPVYTEKGYDPSLPPIRERFSFLPEYEMDGSPRIDLIVGRRPVDEQEAKDDADGDDDEDAEDKENSQDDDDDDDDDDMEVEKPERQGRRRNESKRGRKSATSPDEKNEPSGESDVVEYEYLVKYKNRSYLHLEWKTGADLESMNKSAKTIYRRYLKKLVHGHDEELEDPNFDPSFAEPQMVLAEEEQEMELELSDKELLEWEKEKEKELAEEDSSEEEGGDKEKADKKTAVPKNDDSKENNPVPTEEKKGTTYAYCYH